MTSPTNDASKHGTSHWIPRTWTSPAMKVTSTARRILIPAFVAAMLMSGAMVACGSEAPSSTSETEQPAVVATAQQDQDGNQPDSRDADRDRNGQQPGNNSETPSSGDSNQPTDTPRPTPEPTPTDTPEPTPTPTMVPTPTPAPLDVMVNMMNPAWGRVPPHDGFHHLADYNNALIRNALVSPVADFLTEEYPNMATFGRRNIESFAYNNIWHPESRGRVQWEKIPFEEGELMMKINFYFTAQHGGESYRHEASVNGVFNRVSPPFEIADFPEAQQLFDFWLEVEKLEGFTGPAPVFSHLVGELVVGPAQKEGGTQRNLPATAVPTSTPR